MKRIAAMEVDVAEAHIIKLQSNGGSLPSASMNVKSILPSKRDDENEVNLM